MQTTKKLEGRYAKYMELVKEFARYLLVGGSAFLVDTSVLYLAQKSIFYHMEDAGILISTALGFIAGLIYNYFLSIVFVFKNTKDKKKCLQLNAFLIFALIGVIGLGLTELGMYLGIKLLGSSFYLIIKVFVAAIVLVWNYLGRKVFIFK